MDEKSENRAKDSPEAKGDNPLMAFIRNYAKKRIEDRRKRELLSQFQKGN